MVDLFQFAALAEKVGRRACVPDAPPVVSDPDMIDNYEERAAIYEYMAHMSRMEAERRARFEVFMSINP